MTKKILAIILAAILVAALAACSNNPNEESTADNKINIGGTEGTGTGDGESSDSGETGDIIDPSEEKTPGELEYTEQTGKVYILHQNGAVNLHNADGSNFKSFANGTEFQRLAVSNNGEWTKVVHEDNEYYVYTSCVTELENLDEGFVPCSKTLTLKTSGLNIRIAPSMTNGIIGSYSAGDEVKVVAENTTIGWYKVEFTPYGSDTTSYGYVASDAKHYEAQPEETQPEGTQPAETQPAETQPAGTQPAETQPAETQPAGTQPAETNAPETTA